MGAQQSKITPRDRAILDMKLQRDKLKRYQRNIQATLDRESEIAQQCLAKGDKRRALLALRQRKFQQGLLEKTEEQLSILEQLVRMCQESKQELILLDKQCRVRPCRERCLIRPRTRQQGSQTNTSRNLTRKGREDPRRHCRVNCLSRGIGTFKPKSPGN